MNFKNKRILITGAASGIGYALSKLLTQEGAEVFCFDKQKCQEPVKGAQYLKVDITKSGQIKKALAKVGKPIHILINNAGIMRRGTLFDTSEKDFDLIFNINVKGYWMMLKYTKPYLAKKPLVFFTSSRHGICPPKDPAIYGLTNCVDWYLAEILERTCPAYTVKVACPGPINTAVAHHGLSGKALKQKKKIMKSPEFLAKKIVELLKSDKRYLMYNMRRNNYYLSDGISCL